MNIVFARGAAELPRLVARIVAEGPLPEGTPALVVEGAQAARFAGKAGQVHEAFVAGEKGLVRLAFAGAGDLSDGDRRAGLERAGGALAAKYLTSGEDALGIDFSGTGFSAQDVVSVLLGARLRSWQFLTYRTRLKDEQKPSLKSVIALGAPEGTEDLWAVEVAVAKGVEFTRELVTEPANVIYPESFVARCQERLAGTGVEILVLDDVQMAALGMGALLGVAQGSVRKPRLLAMRWKGKEGVRPTAFVGKGVCFDTGGLDLKTAAGMALMKKDMGGAANVLGLALMIMDSRLKVDLTVIVPVVENAVAGNAFRPGDIYRSRKGLTVQIDNTDAEGRLILADALAYADEATPDLLIDMATLTGAARVALGPDLPPFFTDDEALASGIADAARTVEDPLWRLPLYRGYDKNLSTRIADLTNAPAGGMAGAITAALFLRRFVSNAKSWAHFDIYGWAPADRAHGPLGGEAQAIRALFHHVEAGFAG